MNIDVHPDDVDEYTTDDRGRVYLGTEYANEEVELAVVGVAEDDD
jgi:hypothetical protein